MDTKPFVCTLEGCGETFTLLFDWTRHVRKHAASRRPIGIPSLPSLGSRTAPGPSILPQTPMVLPSHIQLMAPPPLLPTRPSLPIPPTGASGEPPLPLSLSDTNAPVKAFLGKQSRTESPSAKGRSAKKSDTRIEPSSPSLPRKLLPVPASISSEEQHTDRSLGPPASLSPVPLPTPTLTAKVATPEAPQEEARNADQPPQESRLDAGENGGDKHVGSPAPSATSTDETASTISVLRSDALAPPSPIVSTTMELDSKDDQHEEQPNVENFGQEIDTVETVEVEVDPIEVDPVEVGPVEENPVEVDLLEVDPVEMSPVEMESVEVDPVEVDPVQMDSVEVAPVQMDSEEVAPVQMDSVEVAPVQMDSVEVAPVQMDQVELNLVEMDTADMDAVEVAPIKEPSVEESKEQIDIIQSCAIQEQASKWPKIKSKPRGKKDKRQLSKSCSSIFENSTEEIAHYLEHFAMTGPYLECPVPTCRMVFVLESQLKEHGATHDQPPLMQQAASVTIPVAAPSAPSKPAKPPKSASVKSRLTRSQAKTPRSGPSTRKADKNKQEIDVDVASKSSGSSKK